MLMEHDVSNIMKRELQDSFLSSGVLQDLKIQSQMKNNGKKDKDTIPHPFTTNESQLRNSNKFILKEEKVLDLLEYDGNKVIDEKFFHDRIKD
jgi:hypothetical protein